MLNTRFNPRLRGGLPPSGPTNIAFATATPSILGPRGWRNPAGAVPPQPYYTQCLVASAGRSCLFIRFTGEALYLIADAYYAPITSLFWYSIDGAMETQIVNPASGSHTNNPPGSPPVRWLLWSGPYGTHTALVRFTDSFGGTNVLSVQGNVWEIWGRGAARPAVAQFDTVLSCGDGTTWSAGAFENARTAVGGDMSACDQQYVPRGCSSASTEYQRYTSPSVRFRCATTKLAVISRSQLTYVSVDNAAPVVNTGSVPSTGSPLRSTEIACDGQMHDYVVWPGFASNGASNTYPLSPLHVIPYSATFQALSNPRRWEQFGDSITQGTGVSDHGLVDIYRVAAQLGGFGTAHGSAGETTEQLDTRLTNLLPLKPFTSNTNDVAVLAIGRNNILVGGVTPWNAGTTTAYNSCITKLLTKYKWVLCRGLIRTVTNAGVQAENYPTENGYIQAIVAAYGNPFVKFVDTSQWWSGGTNSLGDIRCVDNTHPNTYGYDTLAAYCIRDYPLYLV